MDGDGDGDDDDVGDVDELLVAVLELDVVEVGVDAAEGVKVVLGVGLLSSFFFFTSMGQLTSRM